MRSLTQPTFTRVLLVALLLAMTLPLALPPVARANAASAAGSMVVPTTGKIFTTFVEYPYQYESWFTHYYTPALTLATLSNIYKGHGAHSGVDISNGTTPCQDRVYAAAAGNVVFSGFDPQGFGWTVVIDHGSNFAGTGLHVYTLYAHMGEPGPSPGTPGASCITLNHSGWVSQGTQLGTTGESGDATGTHLHWMIFAGPSDPPGGFPGIYNLANYGILPTSPDPFLCLPLTAGDLPPATSVVAITNGCGAAAPTGMTAAPTADGATLAWQAVSGATLYAVSVYGANGLVAGVSTQDTSWTVGGLAAGAYTWTVSVVSSAGGNSPLATGTFTVGPICASSAIRTTALRAATHVLTRAVADASSCGGGNPTPTPLPSDGDITVTSMSYPSVVGPGQTFVPSITVRVDTGDLEQSRGDMLRCNDPGCDSTPGLRFGAYQLVAVQGTVGTGQSSTFAFYPAYPMTAPNAPGTYTSDWRVWRNGGWVGPNIPITFTVQPNGCATAPTTSSSVAAAVPGNHGWLRSVASVTLSAASPCGTSGLQIHYSINGGGWTTYSGPIAFNQEGRYTLAYYSDGLGPAENAHTIPINIDWTPPASTATATGPRDTNGIFRNDVTIRLQATDNLSGVDYEQYSTDGGQTWTTMIGADNTFPISGEGVSRFLYRAVDIAGNIESPHDSGPIVINQYTVFSNGVGQSLRITGVTNSTLSGDIHSNGGVDIQDNNGSTLGNSLSAVSGANTVAGNTGVILPPLSIGGAPVPMLFYPLSLYQQLATVDFPSDLYIDSVDTPVEGIVYSQGSIYVSAVHLSGSATFVAQHDIQDTSTASSFATDDPHNGMLMMAGGNILINSTGNRALGLYYAPNGTVHVISTGLTLQGSLVGNQVSIDGADGLNVTYNPAFANATYQLPLSAMGAVAPSSPPPPLPSVPSPEGAGPTAAQPDRTILFWSSAAHAVGNQLQVATDPSFAPGTIASDTCHLATDAILALTPGTTYYWRVRAINQAGMSGWSPTATYTPARVPATPAKSPTATPHPPTSTGTATPAPSASATATSVPPTRTVAATASATATATTTATVRPTLTPTSTAIATASAIVPATGAPSLTLFPASGPQGATLTISGSGFDPNEIVDLYWDCPSACPAAQSLGLATTDANGKFSGADVTVPADAILGPTAIGAQGMTSSAFANALFTVLGPDLAVTGLTLLNPAPGANSQFTATASIANLASTSTSTSFAVCFYQDLSGPPTAGTPDYTALVGGLGGNQQTSVADPFVSFATSGAHNLWVFADCQNQVTETNKANNIFGPYAVNVGT